MAIRGLLMGFIIGMSFQIIGYYCLIIMSNWRKACEDAESRISNSMVINDDDDESEDLDTRLILDNSILQEDSP